MSTMNLSRHWKSLGRGKEEVKKQKTVDKRLVNGSLTWRILLRETSYNTKTSSGREASTNEFPPSKS